MTSTDDTFNAKVTHVDGAALKPFPNSEKVYITGSRPDLQVPMRKVSQSRSPEGFNEPENPDIYIYDCSGPYTDPTAEIDIRKGLTRIREGWIDERGDTEHLSGFSSDFATSRMENPELAPVQFPVTHMPRRANPGQNRPRTGPRQQSRRFQR